MIVRNVDKTENVSERSSASILLGFFSFLSMTSTHMLSMAFCISDRWKESGTGLEILGRGPYDVELKYTTNSRPIWHRKFCFRREEEVDVAVYAYLSSM